MLNLLINNMFTYRERNRWNWWCKNQFSISIFSLSSSSSSFFFDDDPVFGWWWIYTHFLLLFHQIGEWNLSNGFTSNSNFEHFNPFQDLLSRKIFRVNSILVSIKPATIVIVFNICCIFERKKDHFRFIDMFVKKI